MADITVKDLKPAGTELFFNDPESFITEIGSEDIANVQGGSIGIGGSIACNVGGSIACSVIIIGNTCSRT
ncbi:hypothetical protein [Nostoc sp. DSM 114167]|jgi:hypothetical protein|uniref:hypothetical protein n=1 Tax=Nostoc sp. DSM 114167 TaxID=3439050 RepID=UPI004045343E